MKAIDKDITVEELVTTYPKSVSLLMSKGIVYVQCGEPVWGTLEEAVQRKNGDVNAIATLLRDRLNDDMLS